MYSTETKRHTKWIPTSNIQHRKERTFRCVLPDQFTTKEFPIVCFLSSLVALHRTSDTEPVLYLLNRSQFCLWVQDAAISLVEGVVGQETASALLLNSYFLGQHIHIKYNNMLFPQNGISHRCGCQSMWLPINNQTQRDFFSFSFFLKRRCVGHRAGLEAVHSHVASSCRIGRQCKVGLPFFTALWGCLLDLGELRQHLLCIFGDKSDQQH